MSLIEWAAPEPYLDIDELAASSHWNASGVALKVTRSIFGIDNEAWFDLGNAIVTELETTFTSPAKAVEFSATLNLDGAAQLSALAGTDTDDIMNIVALDPSNAPLGFEFRFSRKGGIPGNQTYLTLIGGGANVTQAIPNFEVIAGGVYYFTLRIKHNTAAGNDGMVELWCNNILLYSNYTLDFTYLNPAVLETFSVAVKPFRANKTFMRNLTVHNDWTTADSFPPKYKTVIEAEAFNEIDVADFSIVGGAGSVSASLTDNVNTTYIETTTPSSIVKLGFTNIPTQLTTNNVLDVGSRSKFSRNASGFSNPIITISDDSSGLPHATTTQSINVVGAGRQEVGLSAELPSNITLDMVTFEIDSGV